MLYQNPLMTWRKSTNSFLYLFEHVEYSVPADLRFPRLYKNIYLTSNVNAENVDFGREYIQ